LKNTKDKRSTRKKPLIGKFLLDSISIGMYNDPLMVLREYIQNSVDSIDIFYKNNPHKKTQAKIEIKIDGRNRSVAVIDNGGGVLAKKAWDVMHSVGNSLKSRYEQRGFRGIGRLGGLGYCDELRFITKAKGEKVCSNGFLDCKQLRKLIIESDVSLDAAKAIEKISQFSQTPYSGSIKEHFFIVEMHNVRSSKDILLGVPKIKSYLTQTAPVPFNAANFGFTDKIEQELKKFIPSYETYKIYVNEEQIFKPYRDEIKISEKTKDSIEAVDFVKFTNGNGALAFGWIAKLPLRGIINSSNLIDGIRLRSGNILVGDKNLLSELFREKRFNSYLAGEIHIIDNKLVLNSRRDDFEDNESKTEFYNCFVKEIGIPFSKKIREVSEGRSKQRYQAREKKLLEKAESIAEKGYLSRCQKEKVLSELNYIKTTNNISNENEYIDSLVKKIENSGHFLSRNHKTIPAKKKKRLKSIFNDVYNLCSDKVEAEQIINLLIKRKIHL